MKKIYLLSLISVIFSSLFSQIPNYVPTNGLICWYPFTGNPNDSSVNHFNGTINGGVTLSTDRFGNPNQSYLFDGSSGYIDVPDNSLLRLSNTDFTISFWVYINNYQSNSFICKRLTGSQTGYMLSTDNGNGNKVGFIVSENLDTRGYMDSLLLLNRWYNITMEYNLSLQQVKYYVNGVLNTTTLGVNSNFVPVNGIPSPDGSETSDLRFGQDTKNNNYYHDGKLDDIGFWNRDLTQQEITNLYNSSTTTGINSLTNSEMFVYPNPTSNNVFINTGGNYSSDYTIKIVNTLSQVVYQSSINQQLFNVNLDGKSKGIYLIEVLDKVNSVVETKKIILQ